MALFVVACKAEFTPGIADSEVIPAGVQGVVAWQAVDLAVHRTICRSSICTSLNEPLASHYKKNRHCLNDYESCTGYLTYKALKKKEMIEGFSLDDLDEIGSVINCLKRGNLPSV